MTTDIQPKGMGAAPRLQPHLLTFPTAQAVPATSGIVVTHDKLIARPVQGRGMDPAWGILVSPAAVTTMLVRASYADLGMEDDAIRGALVTQAGAILNIKMNFLGFTIKIASGTGMIYVPLYMGEDGIDLTISVATGDLAGADILLLSEEQVPSKL